MSEDIQLTNTEVKLLLRKASLVSMFKFFFKSGVDNLKFLLFLFVILVLYAVMQEDEKLWWA